MSSSAQTMLTNRSFVRKIAARLSNRDDSEHEQAAIRVGLEFLVLFWALGLAAYTPGPVIGNSEIFYPLLIVPAFLILAVAILGAVIWRPAVSVPRRYLAMVADNCAITMLLAFGGVYMSAWFFLYLWITIGYGFRYGTQYLAASAGLSVLGFSIVIFSTPYWSAQALLSTGLLLALVIIPAYVSSLLRKLTNAKAKEEEANRAKSRFLAHMSHELRTPLNAVIGISALMDSEPLEREQHGMVRSIQASARSLLSLINQLLEFSTIHSSGVALQRKDFNLHDVLGNLYSMMRPQARTQGLDFSLNIHPDLPIWLNGDGRYIHQVLVNLIFNAFKFTERGSVTVRVLQCAEAGPCVRFEVLDTGIGIPAEALDRIFDSFSQADEEITRRYGGTGLGLAICKQLVEEMGGRIGVESDFGSGSRFWIELPLNEIPESRAPAFSQNATIVHLCRRGLGELPGVAPAELVQVQDIDAAVGALRASRGGPDRPIVLVADAQLDGIEPLRLAEDLKESGVTVPMVLHGIGVPQEPADPLFRRYTSILAPGFGRSQLVRAVHAAIALGTGGQGASSTKITPTERPLQVLVADDNDMNRRVIEKILLNRGHVPVTVENGEEALDALDAQDFDLVLLDMRMPVMSGCETAKFIRMSTLGQTQVPIVALTADATLQARQDAEEAGMDACLTKPVEVGTLLDTIERLVPGQPRTASEPRKEEVAPSNVVTHPRFAASVHPVIDRFALENLGQLDSCPSFLEQMVENYIAESTGQLSRLEVVLADNPPNLREFRNVIHAMRGSAMTMGGVRLHHLLQSYRDLGPADVFDLAQNGQGYYAEIAAECERLHRALEAFMREVPDDAEVLPAFDLSNKVRSLHQNLDTR